LNDAGVTTIHNNIMLTSSFINNKGIYCQGRLDSVWGNVVTGYRVGMEFQGEEVLAVQKNTIIGGIIGLMINDPIAGRSNSVTIGGSPADKNIIKGQIDPSLGGRAIALGYRDPLDPAWLQSTIPVNASFNDFGVYTFSEIRARIWCKGDTVLPDLAHPIDTVLFNPFFVPKLTVGAKAYLQGAFTADGDSMLNLLNTGGVLADHFAGHLIPALAVDSITIQLRDSLTAETSQKQYSAPAWLMTNGTIRSFTDTAKHYVEFADSLSGDYYVIMRHRNHLAVMSATPMSVENDTASAGINFCTGQTATYGSNATIQMAPGYLGLIAGDANQSAIVTAADANTLFGFMNEPGYQDGDVNLSGIVTAADANVLYGNLNCSSNVP